MMPKTSYASSSPATAGKKKTKKKKAGKNSQAQGKGSDGLSSSSVGVAVATRSQTLQPRITRSAKSMRIAHRELLTDQGISNIPGSSSFSVAAFVALNPGLATSFPWLAPQAAQWEQYKVHHLAVEYIPIVPTSTAGELYISPDYDASDPAPTTESEAANNLDTVSDSCWKRIKCVLNPSAMMGLGPRRFVRTTATAGDIKTFDVGNVYVCTVDQAGSSSIGKIWLEYDFEFFVPQDSSASASLATMTSVFAMTADQNLVSGAGTSMANLAAALPGNPLRIDISGGSTLIPPAGCYRVQAFASVLHNVGNVTSTTELQLYKNGAPLSSICVLEGGLGVAINGMTHVDYLVPCNGTDTINAVVTATQAGGSPKLESSWMNRIIFTLA